MNDLVISNISTGSLSIRGQLIAAASTYVVPFADLSAFAHDAYLRILCRNNSCSILVYGTELTTIDALDWLDKMALGSIVYAS